MRDEWQDKKKKNERKECTAWTMNINDKKSSALKNCIEYIYITVDAKPKNNISTESNWLKEWKSRTNRTIKHKKQCALRENDRRKPLNWTMTMAMTMLNVYVKLRFLFLTLYISMARWYLMHLTPIQYLYTHFERYLWILENSIAPLFVQLTAEVIGLKKPLYVFIKSF